MLSPPMSLLYLAVSIRCGKSGVDVHLLNHDGVMGRCQPRAITARQPLTAPRSVGIQGEDVRVRTGGGRAFVFLG
ncbi:hypothetical protein DPEC_G00181360 [Dallia pectoralis]|uniref:Uncharacterized protein n=1 Tax=Dallia pectoralis TaxID=75939 RepID=A0ACC2GA83_DALPE|nr:hypothetical protein DPEC_G00181360 [Dallia pectoralis]